MIRRLEMALALDTHRSFQRAAHALGVSQPALTRALQALEKEFGARLFERGKAECKPTAFGQIVLARARRIVSEVAETRREIDMLHGLEMGELKIGIGSAGPQQWVGGAIGDLCAANPRLRVRTLELPGNQHADALMAGEIDVAVGDPADLSAYPDIVVARLPRRPIVFFCRPGHPLTKLVKVEMKDVSAFPLAAPRVGRRFGMNFPASSAMGSMSADGRFFEPAILCANWMAIREIVSRSDVVSARVRALVDTPENRGNLAILPFTAPWFCSEISIMWRGDRMPHPALKAFRDSVRRNEAMALGERRAIRAVA
jgi:DNA-binding transcriptional LysR family regulator